MRYAKHTKKWTNSLSYLCWVFLPQRFVRTWVLPFNMKSDTSIFIPSLPHDGVLFSSVSLDRRALTAPRWIFLLSSKLSRAVTLISLKAITRSTRDLRAITRSVQDPRAVTCQRGFNARHSQSLLWWDKEPRSIHLPDRNHKSYMH